MFRVCVYFILYVSLNGGNWSSEFTVHLLTMAPLSFGTIHCTVVIDSIHSIQPGLLLYMLAMDYDGEYYSVCI